MSQEFYGLFYIVKGQYRPKKEPHFFNEVSESDNYIGGFDPDDPTTAEWYMLHDKVMHHCHGAGGSLKECLRSVTNIVTRYKTQDSFLTAAKEYSANVSRSSCRIMEEVLNTYGNPFEHEIEREIDRAFKSVRENKPAVKARKTFKKRATFIKDECLTPESSSVITKKEEVTELVTPTRKRGLRVKRRNHN